MSLTTILRSSKQCATHTADLSKGKENHNARCAVESQVLLLAPRVARKGHVKKLNSNRLVGRTCHGQVDGSCRRGLNHRAWQPLPTPHSLSEVEHDTQVREGGPRHAHMPAYRMRAKASQGGVWRAWEGVSCACPCPVRAIPKSATLTLRL